MREPAARHVAAPAAASATSVFLSATPAHTPTPANTPTPHTPTPTTMEALRNAGQAVKAKLSPHSTAATDATTTAEPRYQGGVRA